MLCEAGHTVDPYLAELNCLRDALAIAVHHVTTSRSQTAASATMLAGLLERRAQPGPVVSAVALLPAD